MEWGNRNRILVANSNNQKVVLWILETERRRQQLRTSRAREAPASNRCQMQDWEVECLLALLLAL